MNTKIALVVAIVMMLVACNSTKKINQTKASDTPKSFEGKIVYDLIYEDRTGAMTKEESKMFMGNEQTYTMKGNKYKSEMDGMMKMSLYYLGSDTLYMQIQGMNSLMWIDATSEKDKLIDYTITENAETIAGIPCDLLTVKSEEGVLKYYFNKKYKANQADYAQHEYGFWKFCIDKTGAIPLKQISDAADTYLEMTAKEIKEMPIDAAEFTLPNLPRVKSPEQ